MGHRSTLHPWHHLDSLDWWLLVEASRERGRERAMGEGEGEGRGDGGREGVERRGGGGAGRGGREGKWREGRREGEMERGRRGEEKGGREKAMVPHSSALAWKIPWVEEPGGLQSMGH